MEKPFWERLLDSAAALALGTFLLYLVAANYLRGYLAFFSVDAEWFSPSAFQLLAFGILPIGLAIFLAGGLTLLQSREFAPKIWWSLYSIWAVVFSIISLLEIIGRTKFVSPTTPQLWITIASAVFLIPLPVISRIGGYFVARKYKAEPSVELPQEMTLQEVDKLRKELAEKRSRLQITVRIVTFGILFYWLNMFSYRVGWATGTYDYLNLASRRSFSAQDHNIASGIIFTDGTSSLCFETRADKTTFSFRNPTAGLAFDFANPGYVFVSKTSPTNSTTQTTTTSNPASSRNP
jgi:hypothetical protein